MSQITNVAKAIVRVLQQQPNLDAYQFIADVNWQVKTLPMPRDQWLDTVFCPMRDEIKSQMDIDNWLVNIDNSEWGKYAHLFDADWLFKVAFEQALYFLARGEYRSHLPFAFEGAS